MANILFMEFIKFMRHAIADTEHFITLIVEM